MDAAVAVAGPEALALQRVGKPMAQGKFISGYWSKMACKLLRLVSSSAPLSSTAFI
jgi:hypothetical protein